MKINESAKVEVYQKQMQSKSIKKTSSVKDASEPKEEIALKTPEDKIDISILKEEANKAYAHLRRIVEDLLKRQGIEVKQLENLEPEDIKVDQKARDEAQQMIDEGGPLSAESVSDRIVDFAKAISDGDKDKLEVLRGAIEEGFEQAKELMGGELPEISEKTYDLIQEKLDAWQNEE